MPLPVLQPSRVTVMVKPMGAVCNLDCDYCYYLPTQVIYGGQEKRMSLETLESVFATVLPNFDDEVTIAWQGGEPTLAGLDFFQKAIEFQEKYRRPNQRVGHALQTNGTLLDDDWCRFLAANRFLIGLSLDGPPHLHDRYRTDRRGGGSHDQVMKGLQLLRKHGVEHNILCVLNDTNVHHPEEVFRYLLNLGPRFLQFIPAIEWVQDPDDPRRRTLAPFSPAAEDYGEFLCRVYDLWFERYRTQVSIRLVDAVLNKLVHGQSVFCITGESCHTQLTIEHDGSVFGCDHFVEPRWQLARIDDPDWTNHVSVDGEHRTPLFIHGNDITEACRANRRDRNHHEHEHPTNPDAEAAHEPDNATADNPPDRDAEPAPDDWFSRVDQQRMGRFAQRKQDLPEACGECEFLAYCYGGCPKHRPHGGDTTEKTAMCAGYQRFFEHAMPGLRWLAGYIRRGMAPPPPGAEDDAAPAHTAAAAPHRAHAEPARANRGGTAVATRSRPRAPGRNDPCPCGSGMKFKKCCGR